MNIHFFLLPKLLQKFGPKTPFSLDFTQKRPKSCFENSTSKTRETPVFLRSRGLSSIKFFYSYHKHRIPKAKEPIALPHRLLICRHDIFSSGQSRHQHNQRRLG